MALDAEKLKKLLSQKNTAKKIAAFFKGASERTEKQ